MLLFEPSGRGKFDRLGDFGPLPSKRFADEFPIWQKLQVNPARDVIPWAHLGGRGLQGLAHQGSSGGKPGC
jgi:hypothetical protein